jgi:hypothetical protein
MNIIPTLTIITIISTIFGCTISPEKNAFGGGRITSASANQMFSDKFEGFTDEELLQLLHPENIVEYRKLTNSKKIKHLRKAYRFANTHINYGLAHRSQIQDRLIAASNQRCNLYKTYLKRVSTYTKGVFGSLTTILGGAGAIVTGEKSARLLSGLAGISSGTRAELNQAIFESIATSIIVPGIENSRITIFNDIMAKRKFPLEKYTVELAMADAITYHGACSMDTGISYAQKSIQSFDDIGVKRFKEIQAKFNSVKSKQTSE